MAHRQQIEKEGRREFLKQAVADLGLIGDWHDRIFSKQRSRLSLGGLHRESMTISEWMVQAVAAFLKSLKAHQRSAAIFSFQTKQRQEWHYTPEPHIGITYKQLDQGQRQLADALLRAGLSPQGFVKASNIISLEPILHEEERGQEPVRDPELYFYALFGEVPSAKQWGWRFEGHHISLNFTLIGDGRLASTPTFFGANPAEVQHGPRKGLRTLSGEEDLARNLLKSLDANQRAQAIISKDAPGDILSGHSRKAEPLKPVGLQASQLSGRQAELLMNLLSEYAGNMAPLIAAQRMAKVRAAGIADIRFAWAGGKERSQGHYYRIQGLSFLIEYDNVQNDANHIHSVWRELRATSGLIYSQITTRPLIDRSRNALDGNQICP